MNTRRTTWVVIQDEPREPRVTYIYVSSDDSDDTDDSDDWLREVLKPFPATILPVDCPEVEPDFIDLSVEELMDTLHNLNFLDDLTGMLRKKEEDEEDGKEDGKEGE